MIYRVGIIKPFNVIIATVKIILFVLLTYPYGAIKFLNQRFKKTPTHASAGIISSAVLEDRFHLLATERANLNIHEHPRTRLQGGYENSIKESLCISALIPMLSSVLLS